MAVDPAVLDLIAERNFSLPRHLSHRPLYVFCQFHQIEERLSTTGVGIYHLFTELYQIRKQRLRLIIRMTERYLESIESQMTVRDYLASIWSLTHGAAAILNSSFYQRYLGSRDTLRVAYIDQALAMPKQTGAAGYLA
jgi:hypothetical protein